MIKVTLERIEGCNACNTRNETLGFKIRFGPDNNCTVVKLCPNCTSKLNVELSI